MPNSRTHLDWYPLELVSYYTITRPSTNSGMLLIGTSFWWLFHYLGYKRVNGVLFHWASRIHLFVCHMILCISRVCPNFMCFHSFLFKGCTSSKVLYPGHKILMLVDMLLTIQIHKQTTYVNELILAMTMFNRIPIILLLIQIAYIQFCRKSSILLRWFPSCFPDPRETDLKSWREDYGLWVLVALIDGVHDRGEKLESACLRGCWQGRFLVVNCKEMMLQTF